MIRRTIAFVGVGVILIMAVIVTAMPAPGFLGIDQVSLDTLEVTVAVLAATFLLWYGLRS